MSTPSWEESGEIMQTNLCPRCGGALPSDAPHGICPKCLLSANLGEPELIHTSGGGYGQLPPPPAPAEIQHLFPQLQVIRLLGRGGMGAVYEARQPSLNRTVALKLLWAPASPEASFEERFLREGEALARLSHAHIVDIHDAGHSGPYYWLLMEFVDGPNLRRVLQDGPIPAARALSIVMQMCEALEYAHEQGVVHRDIKPENVLLTSSGEVKIADFGLAKLLATEYRRTGLTGSLQAMGTPHYMAPEQIERPKEVDHRADIYSLGVVFYEILTGELPIGRFQLPSEKAKVDQRLDGIVTRSLQKEPDRRYQAASEVSTAVRKVSEPKKRARSQLERSRPKGSTAGAWVTLILMLAVGAALVASNYDYLFAGSRDLPPTAESLFERAKTLIGAPSTLNRGLEDLEAAHRLNPAVPGLSHLLVDACKRGSQQADANEALRWASLLVELDPSEGSVEYLNQARVAAQKHWRERLRVTPDFDSILDSRPSVLAGSIAGDVRDVTLSFDGRDVPVISTAFKLPSASLSEGRNIIVLTIQRKARPPVEVPWTVVLDTQKPILKVAKPAPGSVVSRVFAVSGTVEDSTLVRTACMGEARTIANGETWDLEVSIGEGDSSIEVVAQDEAGNTSRVTIPVVVDTQPPTAHLLRHGAEVQLLGGENIAVRPNRTLFSDAIRVADEHGIATVTWNGKPARRDSRDRLVLDLEGLGDGKTGTPLIITDLAGLSSQIDLFVTADSIAPTVPKRSAPEVEVVEGQVFIIAGEVSEDSCAIKQSGKPMRALEGRTFSIPVRVQSGMSPTETFILVDEAGNESGPIRTTFRIVEPCTNPDCQIAPDTGEPGRCKPCSGTGRLGSSKCPNCLRGTRFLECQRCKKHPGYDPCDICNSAGKLPANGCLSCQGKGEINCPECEAVGKKKYKCKLCGGDKQRPDPRRGSVRCNDCDRDGFQLIKCLNCNGSSSIRCPACKNGRGCDECKRSGRKKTPCISCEGTRKIKSPCTSCSETPGLVSGTPCNKCSTKGYCPTCEGDGRRH